MIEYSYLGRGHTDGKLGGDRGRPITIKLGGGKGKVFTTPVYLASFSPCGWKGGTLLVFFFGSAKKKRMGSVVEVGGCLWFDCFCFSKRVGVRG